MRVLVVEDAPRLRATVGKFLSRLGYAADLACDCGEAGDFLALHEYDVIVLDRMLPGGDGLTLLRELRAERNKTPVLVLTALDAVEERVRGLTSGADDYLAKPFAMEELVARIEALARRRYDEQNTFLTVGDLSIDLGKKTVSVSGGDDLELKPREFGVLVCLTRARGRVLSRIQIEEHLYGEDAAPSSNAVDAAVCNLRKALGPLGHMLRTRRGLGYVLESR